MTVATNISNSSKSFVHVFKVLLMEDNNPGDYVRLESGDGFTFLVPESVARKCGTLERMLKGGMYSEANARVVTENKQHQVVNDNVNE